MVNVKKKCDSSGKSDEAMTLHVIDRLLPLSAGRQSRLLCVFFFSPQSQLPNDIKIFIDYAGCSEN